MLVLTNVSKRFGSTVALEPTSLSIATGRTTALIGPSGGGKTPLLRLMLGLSWPDDGEVRFDGQRLTPNNLIAVRRRLGYVIQEGGLFPHITARRNVTLLADYLKWPTERTGERVEELARLVHLDTELLSRYPR